MFSIDERGGGLALIFAICVGLCVCVRIGRTCACVRERQAPLSVPSHMDVGVNGEHPTLPPPLFARRIHMHEADVHVYVCARAREEDGRAGWSAREGSEGGLLITRFPS